MELLGVDLEVPKVPFKRIKYATAIELVNETGKDLAITDDLDPECERILGEMFPEKYGTDMVFITHYPLELRPAYTMPSMTDEGMIDQKIGDTTLDRFDQSVLDDRSLAVNFFGVLGTTGRSQSNVERFD